jgi:hypothetical protein
VEYTGSGINDRDCAGNNLDSVRTNFFYNRELSKDRKADLQLDRMNSTVIATNDTIFHAYFMPTKSLDYQVESHSTGIADLMYKQIDPGRIVFNQGVERYYGDYNITRKLRMRSIFTNDTTEEEWLTCSEMNIDTGTWNESEVFDCVNW